MRIYTYSLSTNIIETLAGYLYDRYVKTGKDLARVAVVFEGKRPALFLARELARRIGAGFAPPKFYSIEEFVREIVSRTMTVSPVSPIDAGYRIFTLTGRLAPKITAGRESFSRFLPWASEIAAFLDHVDRQDVPNERLKSIQASAGIGYDIPQSINILLQNLCAVRDAWHEDLTASKKLSPGLMYKTAASRVADVRFDDYDEIVFCGLYYLYKTEKKIVKTLGDAGKATLFFQGDKKDWPVLEELSGVLNADIRPGKPYEPSYDLRLYAGLDTHSQVSLVTEIVKNTGKRDNTVLVAPDPGALIPLLSGIAPVAPELNVSLGYPLKRSSLFSLLECVFKAQATRRRNAYYCRDYLAAITHPLVKNIRLPYDPSVTRVLVHKIEEILLGIEESPLGGSLFVDPKAVAESAELYTSTLETLYKMKAAVKKDELRAIVGELHAFLFHDWENIATFGRCADALSRFTDKLVRQSFLTSYPLNIKTVERLLDIAEDLGSSSFASETFAAGDIYKIVLEYLEGGIISFAGTPLKGLQVLGMLESRALSFENVIVMDMNESIVPKLRTAEPLIPREVMLSLGLDRVEKEEEIQRYRFMRLISGARHVHLVYAENDRLEKSRFIEELIWARQKKTGDFAPFPVTTAKLTAPFSLKRREREKRPEVVEYLRKMRYSATRVNTYLDCPMKFYFQYVLGLREKEDFSEEPEGAEIGTYVHGLLNKAYDEFRGKAPVIDHAFTERFFRLLHATFDETFGKKMKSDGFLVKEVILHRMQRFLEGEKARPVDEIVHLEKTFTGDISFPGLAVAFEARIDRLDRMNDGTLVVVDYKTGSTDKMPARLAALEGMDLSFDGIKRAVASFQLPIYLHLASRAFPGVPMDAALYDLRTAELKNFYREKTDTEKAARTKHCMAALQYILEEIVNPEVPFRGEDQNRDHCLQCPFFYACR